MVDLSRVRGVPSAFVEHPYTNIRSTCVSMALTETCRTIVLPSVLESRSIPLSIIVTFCPSVDSPSDGDKCSLISMNTAHFPHIRTRLVITAHFVNITQDEVLYTQVNRKINERRILVFRNNTSLQ